jgi:predicted transcriptional regulator of viral defense system
MTSAEALARLRAFGIPLLDTSEAAAALELATPATTQTLGRLAAAKLVQRIRPGVWYVDARAPNLYALADAITAPFPSYVSLQSALYAHGMIEQIPGVTYLISLARTQTLRTTIGSYSIHHITPELFDGFEARSDGTKLATPEKALFDVAYLSGGRSRRFAHLPELELPRMRVTKLRDWISRIVSPRKRSMVTTRLQRFLESGGSPVRLVRG